MRLKGTSSGVFVIMLLLMSLNLVTDSESSSGLTDDTKVCDMTRVVTEYAEKGGFWYDDFSDLSNIESMMNVESILGGFKLDFVYTESFEAYSHAESIFGQNGWLEDTTRDPSSENAQFTASTSAPGSPPTTTVGKVYNPDDEHSLILSDSFDVREGVLYFWMCTENIFYGATGSMSTLVSLMKSNSATPSSSDRVVSVILRDGGLGYRTDPTVNSNMILSSGVAENTWYFFEVEFNCTTEKADIFIYNSLGTLLGSATNTDFMSSASSIRRIELSTVRDHAGEYTTAYWDEFSIIEKDSIGDGRVISKTIDLPSDNEWSTLRIDKEEPEKSEIEIEILDGNSDTIPGFNYDSKVNEIDLSYLNTIGITSLRLKANLKRGPSSSPFLKGWGVEWKKSGLWRDTFLTSLKLERASNIEISDQSATLVAGPSLGIIESEKIEKPHGHYWGEIELDTDVEYPSEILIDVQDGETEELINGYSDLVGPIIDLHDLDPFYYDSIILTGRFFNFETTPLNLFSWSVDWEKNSAPQSLGIISPPSIYRNNSLTIGLDIVDTDQPVSELSLSLEYSPPDSEEWFSDIIDNPYFSEVNDRWEFNFTAEKTAVTGNYSFKLEVVDEFMATSGETIYDDVVTVLNNLPTSPTIVLAPSDPNTNSEITATISTPGSDIETGLLLYNFRWFVNDVEIDEHMAEGLWVDAEPSLPASEFQKGDIVRCEVVADDGEDISEAVSATITIVNAPPSPTAEIPISITLEEDSNRTQLINIFESYMDADSDDMTITTEGEGNIILEMEENGSIMGTPIENWFGDENITISISDGVDRVELTINVIVVPVNDLPVGEIILPSPTHEIEIGGTVEFEAIAEDIETPEWDLTFTWMMGDEAISLDYRFSKTWEEEGVFNITCLISDGDDEVNIGYILLTVVDNTPTFILEDFARSYSSLKGSVMYNIVDMAGSIEDVRDPVDKGLDIIGLTSELIGDEVKFTMQLEGPPLDPTLAGNLIEIDYRIFFVKTDWAEPAFDSTVLTTDHFKSIVPAVSDTYQVGIFLSSGHLGHGTSSDGFGSPTVEGNSVVWRVSAELISNTLVDMDDMALYGVVTYTEQTSDMVVQCFDTAGSGAQDHVITGSPEPVEGDSEPSEEDSPMLFIITGIIILIMLVAIIVLLMMVLRKKETPLESPDEYTDSDPEYAEDSIGGGETFAPETTEQTPPAVEQPELSQPPPEPIQNIQEPVHIPQTDHQDQTLQQVPLQTQQPPLQQ